MSDEEQKNSDNNGNPRTLRENESPKTVDENKPPSETEPSDD